VPWPRRSWDRPGRNDLDRVLVLDYSTAHLQLPRCSSPPSSRFVGLAVSPGASAVCQARLRTFEQASQASGGKHGGGVPLRCAVRWLTQLDL